MEKKPLVIHHCDPESNYANRVAYRPETTGENYYIEFKKGGCYAYKAVPESHFTNLAVCQQTKAALAAGEPINWTFASKPGSEGSYLIMYVVGSKTNRPYEYRPMDAVEAAEIFPYEPTKP